MNRILRPNLVLVAALLIGCSPEGEPQFGSADGLGDGGQVDVPVERHRDGGGSAEADRDTTDTARPCRLLGRACPDVVMSDAGPRDWAIPAREPNTGYEPDAGYEPECRDDGDCDEPGWCNEDGVCHASALCGEESVLPIHRPGMWWGRFEGMRSAMSGSCEQTPGPEAVYRLQFETTGQYCVVAIPYWHGSVSIYARTACADSTAEASCIRTQHRALLGIDLQANIPLWIIVDGGGDDPEEFNIAVWEGSCEGVDCNFDENCQGEIDICIGGHCTFNGSCRTNEDCEGYRAGHNNRCVVEERWSWCKDENGN